MWNEQYRALYDRTYQVLYDAGLGEEMANELATERALAAALRSREHLSRRPAAEMCHDIFGGEFSGKLAWKRTRKPKQKMYPIQQLSGAPVGIKLRTPM
jgi:hypothetical protein